jgi:hypothetical protein
MNNNYTSNFKSFALFNAFRTSEGVIKVLGLISIMGLGGLAGFIIHGLMGSCFGIILGYVIGKMTFGLKKS